MKLHTKVLTILSGITCIAGLSILPASAQSVDVDAVVFAGATGSLTPSVQLSGGTGSFTFGSIACAAASVAVNADGDTPDAEAEACVIAASGTYANMICGTGTADGSATITGTIGVELENTTVNFHIMFTAGVGILTGTAGDGDMAIGVVDIIPSGGNCVTGVSQFLASGAAASVAVSA